MELTKAGEPVGLINNIYRPVGIGWCILTGDWCGFSKGHGRDGQVKCSCKTKKPCGRG
jgi:hypothetical protein